MRGRGPGGENEKVEDAGNEGALFAVACGDCWVGGCHAQERVRGVRCAAVAVHVGAGCSTALARDEELCNTCSYSVMRANITQQQTPLYPKIST